MPGHHDDLKRALRSARHEAGYDSDMALSLAAGVHLQTIQNWMYGKTTPRPHEMSKVASALDKPMDYFMSIYEGRAPQTQPLEEAVADLTAAVRDLVSEIRAERAGKRRSGPMTVSLELPSETTLGVREGDERDRTRRGHGGPNKPVPLHPRPRPDSGEG